MNNLIIRRSKQKVTLLMCLPVSLLLGCVISKQSQAGISRQEVNILSTMLRYQASSSDDIVTALKQLANDSPIPINITVLRSPYAPRTIANLGLNIAEGDYKLKDILSKITKTYPQVTYSARNGTVNITVCITPEQQNPAVQQVSGSLKANFTPASLMQWLDNNNRMSIEYAPIRGFYSDYVPLDKSVNLQIKANETVEDILNTMAVKTNSHWSLLACEVNLPPEQRNSTDPVVIKLNETSRKMVSIYFYPNFK